MGTKNLIYVVKYSFLIPALIFSAGAGIARAETPAERLRTADQVLTEIMGASDKGIPQDLLGKSHCIVIVPGLKKGAFIIGGKFGRGFLLCRSASGSGWSAPGAITVEGGSFGFQIGGEETDAIMLVMSKRGAEKLMASKFTLGGDASVAAGPVGRTSSAETDLQMHAEILTWSRARGVFAGISLNGATLRPDKDTNKELYGGGLTNQEIVMGDKAKPPDAAAELRSNLSRYSARKG
jgi:lipid-binding SYLF domain-containing protein